MKWSEVEMKKKSWLVMPTVKGTMAVGGACEVKAIHMVNLLPSFSQAKSNSNSKRVERYTCTWQRLQFI